MSRSGGASPRIHKGLWVACGKPFKNPDVEVDSGGVLEAQHGPVGDFYVLIFRTVVWADSNDPLHPGCRRNE